MRPKKTHPLQEGAGETSTPTYYHTTADPINQFKAEMRRHGLEPPEVIEADGTIHRFSPDGKRGDSSGWYIYYSDGIPAGAFGDWRTGLSVTWRADTGRSLTPVENTAHNAKLEAIRRERKAEKEKRQADARKRAIAIWEDSEPCVRHPYLTRKGIEASGARLHDGDLVIPLRSGNTLHSLQFIREDGEKTFLPGGRTRGCYYSIGKPDGALCITEGYATGATIHEATGHGVVVAFNAGNLLPVSQSMREKFPDLPLFICADDDIATEGNPGITKATEAANAVGGVVVIPEFGDDRPDGVSDFNDLAKLCGIEAVKHALLSASENGGGNDSKQKKIVQITCASDIKPEPINWLWDGWLARGKFHIFAGQAGTGKTTIALALAATISIGGRFPDGTKSPSGNVLIWSGEDSADDVLVPRLIAAGADLTRVHFIGDVKHGGETRSFDPATDIPIMQDAVVRIGDISLLIVDPVVNAVAGDSHKNGEVRRALQPLVDFGEKLDCAVLGISHFSKGTGGRDPLERVTGSLAFGALARIVLATAKVSDDETTKRIFCRAKSNIGLDHGGFEYDLHQKEIDGYQGIFASYLMWGQLVEGSARELLAEPDNHESGEHESALDAAKEFLRELLAEGELPQKQIEDDAKGAGHSWRTVRRAKDVLGIKSVKSNRDKRWYWKLAGNLFKNSEDGQHVHINYMDTLDTLPQSDEWEI